MRVANVLPKYPVYIISKGRAETRYTSKSLERMGVPYYITVEPQEYNDYAKYIDPDKILVLPFSNHGKGSYPARNWCWEHSVSNGHKRHWILDDNIQDFYRLHNNQRIRVESGACFKAVEDFADRYENVKISGLQYRFFIAPNQKYPPFVLNTRVYSCLLIENDCKQKWRLKYNEDVDICLRVLKDGDCVVQFNAFLQGKMATQTASGGNTTELYHNQMDGQDNADGTKEKSQMLVDAHPDVARMVFRYGRWHHHVDYSSFRKNKLKLKSDVNLDTIPKVNNYGLKLITNYGEEDCSYTSQ